VTRPEPREPVDEEEDTLSNAGLHQAVDLVDEREGLAGAGRHGKEHRTLPFRDGIFGRGVRLSLVAAYETVIVRRCEEPLAVGFEISPHKFKERIGRMKPEHLARPIQLVPDVVMPDNFSVRRVEKRNPEPAKVEGTGVDALGVALRLDRTFCGPRVSFSASTTPSIRPVTIRA